MAHNSRHSDSRAVDDQESLARSLSQDLSALVRTARQLSAYAREDILRGDEEEAIRVLGMLDLRLARTDRFVANLVRYYRAGTHKHQIEEFSLSALCREIQTNHKGTSAPIFTLTIAADSIYCDREILLQVLSELVENAIKHSPQDGSTVEIEISSQMQTEKRLMISVQDNGSGIDPSLVPRLFEPFVTFNTPKRGAGCGLGLAICQRDINSLDGNIFMRPVPTGFAVGVSLPQDEQMLAASRGIQIEALPAISKPELKIV